VRAGEVGGAGVGASASARIHLCPPTKAATLTLDGAGHEVEHPGLQDQVIVEEEGVVASGAVEEELALPRHPAAREVLEDA
jgi:hypothetical protein